MWDVYVVTENDAFFVSEEPLTLDEAAAVIRGIGDQVSFFLIPVSDSLLRTGND
jgi:hypothetical protein